MLSMKRVFVNGYGSIGNRVIQFIKDDPEIRVVGVGKNSPDDKVNDAISRGFDVYVPEKNIGFFKNYKTFLINKYNYTYRNINNQLICMHLIYSRLFGNLNKVK